LNRKDAKIAKDTTETDIEAVAAARVDNAVAVHSLKLSNRAWGSA